MWVGRKRAYVLTMGFSGTGLEYCSASTTQNAGNTILKNVCHLSLRWKLLKIQGLEENSKVYFKGLL